MRGDMNMKWNSLKRKVAGIAFIFTILLGSGMIFETTAQAQYRDRNWERNRDDRRDRDWNRRQQNERARQWERERRNRDAYVYRAPRTWPYGSYGNYGRSGIGGSSNYEVQKGYRDGLDRGQEDARDRKSFNPNNSSHYRSGNGAYREGFRRGYDQGYRQYANYRRW
jgi:hypothetical protein